MPMQPDGPRVGRADCHRHRRSWAVTDQQHGGGRQSFRRKSRRIAPQGNSLQRWMQAAPAKRRELKRTVDGVFFD